MAQNSISLKRKLVIVGIATAVGVTGGIGTRTNRALGVDDCYVNKTTTCHNGVNVACGCLTIHGRGTELFYSQKRTTVQNSSTQNPGHTKEIQKTRQWCTQSKGCHASSTTCPRQPNTQLKVPTDAGGITTPRFITEEMEDTSSLECYAP